MSPSIRASLGASRLECWVWWDEHGANTAINPPAPTWNPTESGKWVRMVEAQPAERSEAAQESVGPFLSPREEAERILTERNRAPQPKDSGGAFQNLRALQKALCLKYCAHGSKGLHEDGCGSLRDDIDTLAASHAAHRKALEEIAASGTLMGLSDMDGRHAACVRAARSALSETGEGAK